MNSGQFKKNKKISVVTTRGHVVIFSGALHALFCRQSWLILLFCFCLKQSCCYYSVISNVSRILWPFVQRWWCISDGFEWWSYSHCAAGRGGSLAVGPPVCCSFYRPPQSDLLLSLSPRPSPHNFSSPPPKSRLPFERRPPAGSWDASAVFAGTPNPCVLICAVVVCWYAGFLLL